MAQLWPHPNQKDNDLNHIRIDSHVSLFLAKWCSRRKYQFSIYSYVKRGPLAHHPDRGFSFCYIVKITTPCLNKIVVQHYPSGWWFWETCINSSWGSSIQVSAFSGQMVFDKKTYKNAARFSIIYYIPLKRAWSLIETKRYFLYTMILKHW